MMETNLTPIVNNLQSTQPVSGRQVHQKLYKQKQNDK